MKRVVLWIILAILCAALLAGCGCKHENVNKGSCETAKTCVDCGETLAEAPGHVWTDATCEAPKTCSLCQKTEGQARGHTWLDATTEEPKTCSACQKTEGQRIITDPRFKTASCSALFGDWELQIPMTGEILGVPEFEGVLDVTQVATFSNDGRVTISVRIDDPEAFEASLREFYLVYIHAEMKAAGISQEEADEAIKEATGMTCEEYVDAVVKILDYTALFGFIEEQQCYYVDGAKLYLAYEWQEVMDESYFHITDNKLTVNKWAVKMMSLYGLENGTLIRSEK